MAPTRPRVKAGDAALLRDVRSGSCAAAQALKPLSNHSRMERRKPGTWIGSRYLDLLTRDPGCPLPALLQLIFLFREWGPVFPTIMMPSNCIGPALTTRPPCQRSRDTSCESPAFMTCICFPSNDSRKLQFRGWLFRNNFAQIRRFGQTFPLRRNGLRQWMCGIRNAHYVRLEFCDNRHRRLR